MTELRSAASLSVSCTSTSYQAAHSRSCPLRSLCSNRRNCRPTPRQQLRCAAVLGLFRKEAQAPVFQSVEDQALFDWLQDRGLPYQKVSLADCRQQGRGLVAKERVKAGEPLLKVPENLLLTPELCLQHCRLAPVLADADLPAWSLLALYIVDVDTAAEGDIQLPWSAYVSALPRLTGCVLEWHPDEVKALKGSLMAAAAQEILDAAERTWAQLQPLIKQAEDRGLIPPQSFTRARIMWGLSMLLSRVARLPARESIEACIPWADFLNHAPDANCYLDWDPSSKAVVLKPDRAYKPGDQIFTSYGPKTDGELLLSYGFVCPPGANPSDACRLRLAVEESDPTYQDKLQSLRQHKLPTSISFPLKLSGLPSGFIQYAAFVEAQPSNPTEVQQLADYLFGQGSFPTLDGVNTELLGIEVALDECRKALKGYPTTLEASQEQLATQQQKNASSVLTSILSVSMATRQNPRYKDTSVERLPGRSQLSSLPLALFEFAIIAVLSALGTVIDQNQTLQFYAEHYPDLPGKALGFLDYKVIWALQWDHIYTADYFLLLLATLAASLAACTTTRQWPMLKVARRWRFASTPEIAYKRGVADNAVVVPNVRLSDVGQALLTQGYQTFLQRRGSGGSLYAFKGLAGKIGPIGVHASMLAIMAGVSLGGVGGWKGSVQIPEGGDASFRQILHPVIPWAPAPKGADDLLHVNNFEVKYRSDGSVEQFVSNLSVYTPDGEQETARKEISVNKPLRYKGITAYQTDYNMVALTVRASNSPLQPLGDQAFNLPMANLEDADEVQGKLWATFLPSQENSQDGARHGVSMLAKDFQLVTLYKADGTFAGVRRIGSGTPIEVEGMRIVIDGAVGSTGLELKVDPGVPYVYAGFGGMMLTTLMSYMSHSQIWALEKDGRVHVGGKTNRATVEFFSELTGILASVPQQIDLGSNEQRPLAEGTSEQA
ncbi:hypothetical protein WJX73_002523 [Symbiochloris irregularis]|uniref:SET domain-containing protein n=1 Tax=Symbiochloris irregularis TaxID=706552 RepID=A0AAW1NPZ1_9CHLO